MSREPGRTPARARLTGRRTRRGHTGDRCRIGHRPALVTGADPSAHSLTPAPAPTEVSSICMRSRTTGRGRGPGTEKLPADGCASSPSRPARSFPQAGPPSRPAVRSRHHRRGGHERLVLRERARTGSCGGLSAQPGPVTRHRDAEPQAAPPREEDRDGIKIGNRTYVSHRIREFKNRRTGIKGQGRRWPVCCNPCEPSRMWLYDHTVEKDPARSPWVLFDFKYQHLIRDAWTQYLWEKAADLVSDLVSGLVGREGSGKGHHPAAPPDRHTAARRRHHHALPRRKRQDPPQCGLRVRRTHRPQGSGRPSSTNTPALPVLAVHQDLAQHAAAEAGRLERALQHLLAHTTPARLIAAVGHCLIRTSGAAPC